MGVFDDTREEIEEMKKELNEVKEESFATQILRDYKKSNKRMFIIILVILVMWFLTMCDLIYTKSDIGTITEEYNQEITDLDNIDNSTINNGGK